MAIQEVAHASPQGAQDEATVHAAVANGNEGASTEEIIMTQSTYEAAVHAAVANGNEGASTEEIIMTQSTDEAAVPAVANGIEASNKERDLKTSAELREAAI